MKIVGIDIGTTTISAVVMDMDSLTVVHRRTVKNDSFLSTRQPWERIQDVQPAKGLSREKMQSK